MSSYARAFKFLTVTLAIGALLAWAGSWQGLMFNGWPVFALSVLLAFVIQWVVFIPAFIWQTERYFDLTGSLTYLSVIGFSLVLTGKTDIRTLLLATMVAIWAVRLGSFLFARISQDGSDSRFDAIKPNFWRFLSTWTLQGLWVSFTCAAALVAIASGSEKPMGIVGIVGVAIWVLGFVIEVVADRQKSQFRADPANKGKFIDVGLWARSRHPNYFGEITLWLGVAVLAAPVLSGWQYVGLISPVFVALLLIRVSGIPMLEKSADKRWGGDERYEAYKARTPVLIPSLSAVR
ncbi:MAG: DUF1295 domain-containing protein [Pseudomonadota bacterium]